MAEAVNQFPLCQSEGETEEERGGELSVIPTFALGLEKGVD